MVRDACAAPPGRAGPVTAPDRADPRRQMLEVITAHALTLPDRTGPRRLDARVMQVMATLPREAFVPPAWQHHAYEDRPLPIGCGKTISQPFIVALMSDLLDPQPTDRVLEIGTGLGYQTAVLARLAGHVYTVERLAPLADEARERLAALGIDNVSARVGNGWQGWPEHAPFDRIMVTGAPATVPPALVEQLRPGGRLVLPVGPVGAQQLVVIDKDDDGDIRTRHVLPVSFSTLDDSEAG